MAPVSLTDPGVSGTFGDGGDDVEGELELKDDECFLHDSRVFSSKTISLALCFLGNCNESTVKNSSFRNNDAISSNVLFLVSGTLWYVKVQNMAKNTVNGKKE